MRISFAPTTSGEDWQQVMVSTLNGCVARVVVRDDSPNYAGQTLDMYLRGRSSDHLGAIRARTWDRTTTSNTGPIVPILAERIHIY